MKDMKRYLFGLAAMAVAAIMVACSLDELPQEAQEQKAEVGYLQFNNFVVVSDLENNDSDTEIETGTGEATSSLTRAGEQGEGESGGTTAPDFSNYYIEIINKAPRDGDNPVVWNGLYSTIVSAGNKIPLEPGNYTVWAYQTQSKYHQSSEPAQDAPYYAGNSDVTIKSTETSQVTVTCHLFNIRVSVELSADLKKMFKVYDAADEKRLKTDVSIGKGDTMYSYTFEKESTHDTPHIYFKDVAGRYDNTMKICLQGDFYTGSEEEIDNGNSTLPVNDSKWKTVKMEKTIAGIEGSPLSGGQWRKISIDIEHNDEGNAQIIFEVSSYVYDSEIEVRTMTGNVPYAQEEEIQGDDFNDPSAPQVFVEGVTADENNVFNYQINAEMRNENLNKWIDNLSVKVAVPDGSDATVKSVWIEFKETASALLQELETKGYNNGIVSLFPNNGAVNDYVYVNSTGTEFTLQDKGMDAIYEHEGTHKIRVHTEGSDGRLGFADIVIKVSQAASTGPKVAWKVDGVPMSNISFSESNFPDEIIAEIISATGLTKLNVVIESDVIPEEDLGVLNLAKNMNILDPETDAMKQQLTAFGFLPLNDPELKDIKFTISGFVPTLAGLGSGKHTFTIIAGDQSGETTKAIEIIVE